MKPTALRWLSAVVCFAAVCAVATSAGPSPRVVHVFVALADNQHQGIVPVPAFLGNGEDPAHNLYWGAEFGVKTYFKNNAEWELLRCDHATKMAVLERCIFKSRGGGDVYLVADAYDGSQIKKCVADFLSAAAGTSPQSIPISTKPPETSIAAGGAADLLVYVGHDAFMDFQIPTITGKKEGRPRRTIILACASKPYFASYLRATGAEPLLWTTGLMAPEAYILQAALAGWITAESDEEIRRRAAAAYDKYQKCGARAALRLFVTGW